MLSPADKTASAQSSEVAGALAVMNVSSDMITWQPVVDYASLTLVVVMPSGAARTSTFDSGNMPILSVAELPGDGLYSYELRMSPVLDEQTQAALQAVADDPQARSRLEEDLIAAGVLPTITSQSGSFSILSGQFVIPVEEKIDETSPLETQTTGGNMINDILHYDDVIVTGSFCVGFDCVNGESFGFDTIILKENNLRIFFNDTSTTSSFPTNNWRITANDSVNGGANYFSIDDADRGVSPFKIEAGAPANSLYVEDYGRIGLGTSTPATELHIIDGWDTIVRLEQDSSSGLSPQTWDVIGNEIGFYIRDVTHGSKLPFRIQPNTPSNTLYLKSSGYVGMGTSSPAYPLEVETTGKNSEIVAQRTDGASAVLSAITNTVQIGSITNHPIEVVIDQTPVMTVTGEGKMTLQGASGAAGAFSAISNTVQIGSITDNDVQWVVNNAPVMTLNEDGQMTLQSPSGGAIAGVSAATNTAQIGSFSDHDVEMVVNDTVVMTMTSAGNMTLQGALSEYSDVNVKENFAAVDSAAVLNRLNDIPITTWNYISDDADTQHMGPMAQDFYAAFELGADDRHIASLDVNGVSLAAIQALNKLSADQKAQIDELSAENISLKEKVDDLESRLNTLEQAAGSSADNQSTSFPVWSMVIALLVVGMMQTAPVVYCKIKKN